MREEIILFIVGTLILGIGSSAVTAYLVRLRSRERVMLWFGLFAGLYGAVLMLRILSIERGLGNRARWGLSSKDFSAYA